MANKIFVYAGAASLLWIKLSRVCLRDVMVGSMFRIIFVVEIVGRWFFHKATKLPEISSSRPSIRYWRLFINQIEFAIKAYVAESNAN